MGLFDLLGKKQKTVQRAEDPDILSGAGMIEYIKSHLDDPSDKNVLKAITAIAAPDADQEHLTSDGELPWGWLSRNTPTLKAKYEDKMVAIAVSLNRLTLDEKKAQLKKLIALYNEFKEFCYSKDECFAKYFSDMWEHCHNSRCKDFEYIASFEAELKNIEENYEELRQKEQRTSYIEKNILPTLRHSLMETISAEPGIFQADLFNRFDADLKPFIHTELYLMEKDGLLLKEKEGRRNRLFLNQA